MMFHDRADAAVQLAELLRERNLLDPLILAIPRGGVVTGAILAWELGADFDVVLSRKLRDPGQPEFALGAISENGQVYIAPQNDVYARDLKTYLDRERRMQQAEIDRRKHFIREVIPKADPAGRSVVLTDDGIATGSTMIAALQTIRLQKPHELIVAVPVGPPSQLQEVRRWCDEVICLHTEENFMAIGQFYEDFSPVEDAQMLEILHEVAQSSSTGPNHALKNRE